MFTGKERKEKLELEDVADDLGKAKRDLVMRFVKDQEALQTSQVDLKLVDDETIDLIDSALVARGEETKRTNRGEEGLLDLQSNRTLVNKLSSLSLHGHGKSKCETREPVIIPRPPSGRPRARSVSSRNKMVSRSRKYSHDLPGAPSSLPSRDKRTEDLAHRNHNSIEINPRCELNSPFEMNDTESGVNLNASWPQEFLSKTFSIPPRKQSARSKHSPVFASVAVENFSGIGSPMEDLRPRSSQCFQQVPHGEILTARISSATQCERITCDPVSLTKPSTYLRKLQQSSRRRAYINFNRLDAQLAFEGPLELEPVHPSGLPLYRSTSAASSNAPYALVHVPPIGQEGPAPSSS